MPRGLAHRVGRALKPLFAFRRLLGGQHLDEAAGEQIHPVRLRDMPVERRRVELRQDVDPLEPGVQTVAERNVDQPVLAADRHRRLRAMVGEWEEPSAAAAAEHDREHAIHRRRQFYATVGDPFWWGIRAYDRACYREFTHRTHKSDDSTSPPQVRGHPCLHANTHQQDTSTASRSPKAASAGTYGKSGTTRS